MIKGGQRESATILPFPSRVRPRDTDDLEPRGFSRDGTPRAVSKAAVGSGWYHEAAIQEALGSRKQ